MRLIFVLWIFAFSATALAAELSVFQNGQVANAEDVNANFQELSSRADANSTAILTIASALDNAYRATEVVFSSVAFSTSYGSSLSEVLSATCPAGSTLVGGGVQCSTPLTNFATTNAGVVESTIPAGNSIIGTCAANGLSWNSLKFGPGITVRAICLVTGTFISNSSIEESSDKQSGLPLKSVYRTASQGALSEEAANVMRLLEAQNARQAEELENSNSSAGVGP